MFETKNRANDSTKNPGFGPHRRPVILLLCLLILFSIWSPVTTFSRYIVNLNKNFTLDTTSFYMVPSLTSNQLLLDKSQGSTENLDLKVSNFMGSDVTTHNMMYSIILSESGIPLFDLYIDDGQGNMTKSMNNAINGSLTGSSADSDEYTLGFKLKDGVTAPEDSKEVNLVVASSEPYIRSYTFKVTIKVEESGMIIIPDTEILRPDVEIPEGEILVFKEDKFVYLTVEDLLGSINYTLVVDSKVDDLGRPDLVGGNLYVPASTGDLILERAGNKDFTNINWDVAGHVVLETNIVSVNTNTTVNILSHGGDVIFNGSSIVGEGSSNEPYKVSIVAENGKIEGHGSVIESRSHGQGTLKIQAKQDVDLGDSSIISQGDKGIEIRSTEGSIDASNTAITSTNGASTARVVVQSAGSINLDGSTVTSKGSPDSSTAAILVKSIDEGISAKSAIITSTNGGRLLDIAAKGDIELDLATVSSGGNINIGTQGDITARSANIFNNSAAYYSHSIQLNTTAGAIDISSLESKPQTVIKSPTGNIKILAKGNINAISANITASTQSFAIELISQTGEINISSSQVAGVPATDITGADNILIKAGQDVHAISAKVSASTGYGKELRFESTGSGKKLWVSNARLVGKTIRAVNLSVQGVPAQGTIQ